MGSGQLSTVIRHLRRCLGAQAGEGLADTELLERWVSLRDEAAFEVLVWRHGPLVLSVCRRLLARSQDVEDAFQATFLTLVRKAGSIRKRQSVSSWLYRVAYRVALRARSRGPASLLESANLEEHAGLEQQDLIWSDLRPVLDEEINRLPSRYRETFIRCYLEGRTNEEAARDLGCPLGTVLSRLAWARDRLRSRLTRRGITLTSGIVALVLSQHAANAAVPASLVDPTMKAAMAFAAGKSAAAGLVSANAVALTEGVLHTMFLKKIILAVAVLFVVCALGAGVGLTAFRAPAPAAAVNAADDAGMDLDRDDNGNKNLIRVPAQQSGIVVLIGTEIKKDEVVPRGLGVAIKVGEETKHYRRLREGDMVEEGQLLARVDDRLARDQVAIKEALLQAAEADRQGAEKTRDEAERRYRTILGAFNAGRAAKEELDGARLTHERYVSEEVSKKKAVEVAKLEVKQAQTLRDMHEIHSPVRGTIRSIHKQRGEAVKALETVILIRVEKERE